MGLDETQPPCQPAVDVVAAHVIAQPNGCDGDQQGRGIAYHLCRSITRSSDAK